VGHARWERVADVGEERLVVVDARRDGVCKLDERTMHPVLELDGRRRDETAGAAAKDRAVGKPIREPEARRVAIDTVAKPAITYRVTVDELERAEEGLAGHRIDHPLEHRVHRRWVEAHDVVVALCVDTGEFPAQ